MDKRGKLIRIIVIIAIIFVAALTTYLVLRSRTTKNVSVPETAVVSQAGDEKKDVKVIRDVTNWEHPVKNVLLENGVNLQKVALFKEETYPVFYVEFHKDLTPENEGFFQNIIKSSLRANSFFDYKIIDEEKNITIEVFGNRTLRVLERVLINGNSNYFYELGQFKKVEKYKFIDPIGVKDVNGFIDFLIKNKWEKNGVESFLGKKDSAFQNYDVYFDKGIRVKTFSKVFNILFDEKYQENIVNNISMKSSRADFIRALGKPHFENKEGKVIGYKTSNFYIFFVGDNKLSEVSVYRRDRDYKKDGLKNVLLNYKNKEYSNPIYVIAEEIIKEWPYPDLNFKGRGLKGVKYFSRGVEIVGNPGSKEPFITIKGNFVGSLSDSLAFPEKPGGIYSFKNDIIRFEFDKDSVFEYELSRLQTAREIESKRKDVKSGITSPNVSRKVMENNGEVYEYAGAFILSLNKDKPDIEFYTGHFPSNFTWLSDRYIIFSVDLYGISIYDTQEDKVIDIDMDDNPDTTGDYEITRLEDGIILARNRQDGKLYDKNYYLDDLGNLIIY